MHIDMHGLERVIQKSVAWQYSNTCYFFGLNTWFLVTEAWIHYQYEIDTHKIYIRVANVVADHDSLLTQWRPIKMSKFRANIFLIRTTSNYFWASEIRGLKVTYFHFPSTKNIPNWKHELIFMQLSFFINKIKNLRQFSEKYFSKNGP